MMVKLREHEIKFLKENFENADALIQSEKVNDILDPLDELIVHRGFDEDYDLNVWGQKAQKIYDDIFYNNEE